MTPPKPAPRRLFKNRAAWRAWLEKNHGRESAIELVYYKKSAGKSSVTYEEALQEALCFGWIDSTVSKLDTERYKQRYTPRNPKSAWSASNKERVARLIRAGRMAKPGREAVAEAKKNGSWGALDRVDRPGPEISPELLAAIGRDPRARDNFARVTTSQRKMFAWFILSAKRPETRARRIARCLEMIRTGEKFGIDWRISPPSAARIR
jgi:uncharacterized protein YdeI (YjbR/CyaY-like superfamily)